MVEATSPRGKRRGLMAGLKQSFKSLKNVFDSRTPIERAQANQVQHIVGETRLKSLSQVQWARNITKAKKSVAGLLPPWGHVQPWMDREKGTAGAGKPGDTPKTSVIMYHGTSKDSLKSIMKEGLAVSFEGPLGKGVYLSGCYDDALEYAKGSEGGEGVVIAVLVDAVSIAFLGDPASIAGAKDWRTLDVARGCEMAWVPPRTPNWHTYSGEAVVTSPDRVLCLGIASESTPMIQDFIPPESSTGEDGSQASTAEPCRLSSSGEHAASRTPPTLSPTTSSASARQHTANGRGG
eukprot:CAMPEP_0174917970 /NCGR_PEP_ID=MMETSP1355-20121228/2816_1 /TAXON_ID=464990 /ORGANISM="Hemiselmis tepida, Strain CCMP443" /LENGTH=292 /DNA_ID=CAMNT_0016163125 /DNA_START=42 /DNA_END=917 /DNA_ORIENTATION=+